MSGRGNGRDLFKELVTGEDSCTAGTSGGPSNAVSSLADAIFGGSARYEQHVGRSGNPSPLAVDPRNGLAVGTRNMQERALAHAMQSSVHEQQPSLSVDEFLAKEKNSPLMFDQVFNDVSRFQNGAAKEDGRIFHAFLHSQAPPAGLQGGPPPDLNVREKCHVRDRSTILARQLFIERGEEYIARHVGGLLQSLSIDTSSLPKDVRELHWEGVWQGRDSVAGDHAAGLAARSHDTWANEFTKDAQQSWEEEFSRERDELVRKVAGVDLDTYVQSTSALEHTRRLAETLSAETDPKFKHSKFLQFVSKMSRGELIVDGNEVREVDATSAEWAGEFTQQQRNLVDEYLDSKAGGADWAGEFAQGMGSDWVNEFSDNVGLDWADAYLNTIEHAATLADGGYRMTVNNPFLTDIDSFTKGRQLFQQGLLTEAVLAIEAECQRNPGNADAWKLLGTVQAENDDDIQSIAAMNRALACDPANLEVLLSLGVSHTNEFDQKAAVGYLRQWLATHPRYRIFVENDIGPLDSSQTLSHAVKLFRAAAQKHPDDADIHAALGVLCNLARQYEDAVTSFRLALKLNDKDYSLWNKLGATLANSSRSGEAIDAYMRALELKPNYMRAWINMGISLANLGEYENSARYYIRALTLNANSSTVWGYLRTSLICGSRDDLLGFAEESNLEALRNALPL
jgi:peroxin-5